MTDTVHTTSGCSWCGPGECFCPDGPRPPPDRCEHGVFDDDHCEQCCGQCQQDIAEMLKQHSSDDEVTSCK